MSAKIRIISDIICKTGYFLLTKPEIVKASDNFWACLRYLSKDGAFVHTSRRRIRDFSWNREKVAVTLHRQKETKTK